MTERIDIPVKFGNNLFMLFEALRIQDEEPDAAIVDTYLVRKAQRAGGDIDAFVEDNSELIEAINFQLENLEALKELFVPIEVMYRSKEFEDGDDLAEEIGYWSLLANANVEINPLLEDAAEKMRSAGIDPGVFIGQ